MSVAISSIADRGDLAKERLVMKVSATGDIGEYVVFRTGFNGESPTVGVRDTFWFPDKPVKAGDFVVLYSKEGKATERINKDGTTSHFFYWGKRDVLWNADNTVAVLLHVDNWQFKVTEQPAAASVRNT